MNPAVKKRDLKMTKTGEMRVAYSPQKAVTMIGPPLTLPLLQFLKKAGTIPPSIFVFEEHFYTRKQITLLKAGRTGQFPQNVEPRAYLYEHWNDPDDEE
jgi:hypothetical protein